MHTRPRRVRGVGAGSFQDRPRGAGAGGEREKRWDDLIGDHPLAELAQLRPGKDDGPPHLYLIPLPTRDEADPGAWAPGLMTGPGGDTVLGPWMAEYPVHRFGELKQVSLVPFDPLLLDDSDDEDRRVIWEKPTMYFRNVIWKAARTDRTRVDLDYLIDGKKGVHREVNKRAIYGAYLPQYETNYFVRGLVLQSGLTSFSPPKGLGGKVPTFLLSRSAAQNFFNALVRDPGPGAGGGVPYVAGAAPDPADGGVVEMDDPTDFAAPQVLCFYQEGCDPTVHPSRHHATGQKHQVRRFSAMPPNFADPIGRDPRILAQYAGDLFGRLVPFSQVVKVAGDELQMRRLAEAFKPETVRWAFRERPELLAIAEDVWSRTTTVQPGAPAPAGYPQPGAAAPQAGGGYHQPGSNGGYPQPAAGYPQPGGMAPPANGGYPQPGGVAPPAPAGYPQPGGTAPPASAGYPQPGGVAPPANGGYSQPGAAAPAHRDAADPADEAPPARDSYQEHIARARRLIEQSGQG